jgi:hypothetical protein
MQEMHKEKLYICYKGAPTTNSRNQPHTTLTNDWLLEGRQKGLDTTSKREKEHKTHKLP